MEENRLTVRDLRGRVNIGLITVRPDEFAAVESMLGKNRRVEGTREGYVFTEVTRLSGEKLNVVVARAEDQGNIEAQALATSLIDDFDPSWLMVVGIAGGVPSSDFSLGDVVVATRLHDFSISAASQDGLSTSVRGGRMHDDVARFLAVGAVGRRGQELRSEAGFESSEFAAHPSIFAENVRPDDAFYGTPKQRETVREALQHRFPDGQRAGGPIVTLGSCGNGGVLLKDHKLLNQWRIVARDVTHVEMELSGVYAAATRNRRKRIYPVLAIRGISDVVGLKRHPAWTPYAARTAAAFAAAVIRAGELRFTRQSAASRAKPTVRVPRASPESAPTLHGKDAGKATLAEGLHRVVGRLEFVNSTGQAELTRPMTFLITSEFQGAIGLDAKVCAELKLVTRFNASYEIRDAGRVERGARTVDVQRLLLSHSARLDRTGAPLRAQASKVNAPAVTLQATNGSISAVVLPRPLRGARIDGLLGVPCIRALSSLSPDSNLAFV